MDKPRVQQSLLPGVFSAPERKRRTSFTTSMMQDLKGMLHDQRCTCEKAYNAVKSYVVYGAKTAGRRGLTLFDVITDMNSFLILWKDDHAAYWACFLLSSIMLPYIVFWASSHNFEDATRAHTLFNKKSARTCGEKLTRLYYCLIAMPIVGLVLTFFQITMWWLSEIFLGTCWQSKHKQYVHQMEKREMVKFTGKDVSLESEGTQQLFRSVPMIPSANAARYLTIIELFFESIPQCMLQLYIYVQGTSSYFTFHDVLLSVSASVLNIAMNGVMITHDAHAVGMNLQDYIVYFMGNRIGDMMGSLVPINKVLISSKRHVCKLTGFSTMYLTDVPRKMHRVISSSPTPVHMKTIILPPLRRCIHASDLEALFDMIVATRHKINIHVTMLANTAHHVDTLIVCDEFIGDSKEASDAQRTEACTCMDNVQEGLNVLQCCSLKCGDFLFGEKEYTIDEAFHVRKNMRCCGCFTACTSQKAYELKRRDSKVEKRNKLKKSITFLWPAISDTNEGIIVSSEVANILMLYALVGDYPILLAIHNVLAEHGALGKAFLLLCEVVHGRLADTPHCARTGRKRWVERETKQEQKQEQKQEREATYKPIPLKQYDMKTFAYEIICSTLLRADGDVA